jgi:hypothetical protein
LPYIVVLTHPTTGGVTASYAMLGDVQIAEPGRADLFRGPPRHRTDHPREAARRLPAAEYLLDHGMLDRVTHRKDLRDELITITRMLMGLSPAVMGDLPPPDADGARPPTGHGPGAGTRRAVSTTKSDILLDRMMSLHPKLIDLTLDRMWRILGALDHPERLPPVMHIAGTNGKGSTLAMIRAGLEGAGLSASMPTPRPISCASTNASALPAT